MAFTMDISKIIPAKTPKKTSYETKIVKESDVEVKVDVGSISPKHSDCNFDVNLRLTRCLVANTLAAYCQTDFSLLPQIKCVEAIGSTGINALIWAKHVPLDKINIVVNAPSETAKQRISENVLLNDLADHIDIIQGFPRAVLDENTFNFIHLECFSQASLYFDSSMSRMPRGGLLAISTIDDPSLYCKTPEVALRNYAGLLGKTTYSVEMGARLVIAAIARAAGRHNRAIRVMWVYCFKGMLSMVIQVDKGPAKANECLKKLKRLVHCNMCEDRAFMPDSNFLCAEPYSLLNCDCKNKVTGKTAIDLGPFWSGELFDPDFLNLMMEEREKYPWAGDVKPILDKMLEEALCLSSNPIKTQPKSEEEPANKKAKITQKFQDIQPAPCFYFNLPKHGTKMRKMLRADRVVEYLRNSGFRASRTHFDPESVRTNASLKEVQNILTKGILPPLKEERHSADF